MNLIICIMQGLQSRNEFKNQVEWHLIASGQSLKNRFWWPLFLTNPDILVNCFKKLLCLSYNCYLLEGLNILRAGRLKMATESLVCKKMKWNSIK